MSDLQFDIGLLYGSRQPLMWVQTYEEARVMAISVRQASMSCLVVLRSMVSVVML